MRLLIILGFISFLSACESANILGIFPIGSTSHFVMFDRLARALADKGHHIDVLSVVSPKNPPATYNHISLAEYVPNLTNSLSVKVVENFSLLGIIHFMTKLLGSDLCKQLFETEVLKNLKNTEKKYDLLITEVFGTDCMYGFGHVFNVPTISMVTSIALPWLDNRIGNPNNPSYIPNYFMEFGQDMNFLERIFNTLALHVTTFGFYWYSSIDCEKSSREFFGPDIPTLASLAKNTSLIFINSHYSFPYARPAVPNFIEVGGLHINEPKPLSEYFEKAVSTSTKGVILLSMGSMIMTETFNLTKLQAMFDAFAEVPYKILWKGESNKFPKTLKIPGNIQFESWLPQVDILCHPNIKLFVSHGGMLGSQEGTFCGVPILGFPLFADQKNNLKTIERKGYGIMLPFQEINKQKMLDALTKLLTVSSYSEAAKQVSIEFRDRPMSALDTAIFWTEYVIRHKGAPQLRSKSVKLYWFQYYLIDVYATIILIAISIIYLVQKIFKFILRFLITPKKSKTE